jgi:Flp pilus assembly protein TadG
MTQVPRAGSRLRGDDGAVMVEAALLTPLLVFILFGTLEFGLAFRTFLTTSNAASAGTRMAAIQGNRIQADFEILQAVRKASTAISVDDIQYVVIFKASGPNMPVPTACKTASQNIGTTAAPLAGSCNRYLPSDLKLATMPVTWTCGSGPMVNYCPPTRKIGLNDPPDFLGVFIETKHKWITGLFGSEITMSDTSITRLEPQRLTS